MSVWPVRQARPAVSVTSTATLRPMPAGQRLAQPARRGVRVQREQHRRCRRRCWRRRSRRRPSPGRGGCARSTVRPRRATVRSVSSASASSRLAGAHPALGLADHLAGHDQDVAVLERRRRRRAGPARSSPSATSPMPVDGQAGQPVGRAAWRAAHAPARHGEREGRVRPSRRWRRGRSSSGVRRRQAMPAARTRSTSPASAVSTSQPSRTPPAAAGAVVLGDAGGADLHADRGEQLRGHAAHVAAGDDGGEADDRCGGGAQRVADAGHAEDRADRHDRVGGRHAAPRRRR